MAPGWAADDGAALHFVGSGLSRGRVLAPAGERLPGRRVDGEPDRGRRWRWSTSGRRSRLWPSAAELPTSRTIFAMGGGGFTMEPEASRSTTTCSRSRRRASRASACCRRRAATPRSRSAASRSRSATACASPPRLAVPARPSPGLAARPPARPGRHLRRRRLDDQPAGAVARPRARRDPARGVAGRDRARRAERRLDVLVRARHHEVARPPDARGRARLPAGLELRALRRRARAPARLPRGGRLGRAPAGLRRRRRRGAAVPRHAPRRGRRLPRRPARLPRHGRRRRAPTSTSSSRACSPAAHTSSPAAVPHDIGELRLHHAARRGRRDR